MTILISILVIAGFSVLLWKLPFFRNTGLKSRLVLCAFYVKLLVAAAFYVLYAHYPPYQNQSDSQEFYSSAAQFAAIAHEDFGDFLRASFRIPVKSPEIREKLPKIEYWNRPYDNFMPNDTRQTLILYSFLYLLTFGSLPAMLIVANFLAFCGLFALFKAFLGARWLSRLLSGAEASKPPEGGAGWLREPQPPVAAAIACFAIPSTLFWSSGLMKEVWLLLFMGFTLYSAVQFFITKKMRFAIFALLWGIALLHIKIYIALFLLPLLAIYAIRRTWQKPNAAVFYGCAFAVLMFLAYCAHWFVHFNIIEVLVQQRNTFIRMLEFHNHSAIVLQTFDESSNFVAQMFVGLGNVFLCPSVFNVQNVFVFFAGLENTVIAALIICSIILHIKKRSTSTDSTSSLTTTLSNQIPSDYTILAIVFVVAVFAIIGFTTPNMGALMRYKSVLLPFVVVLHKNILFYIHISYYENYKTT